MSPKKDHHAHAHAWYQMGAMQEMHTPITGLMPRNPPVMQQLRMKESASRAHVNIVISVTVVDCKCMPVFECPSMTARSHLLAGLKI